MCIQPSWSRYNMIFEGTPIHSTCIPYSIYDVFLVVSLFYLNIFLICHIFYLLQGGCLFDSILSQLQVVVDGSGVCTTKICIGGFWLQKTISQAQWPSTWFTRPLRAGYRRAPSEPLSSEGPDEARLALQARRPRFCGQRPRSSAGGCEWPHRNPLPLRLRFRLS